MGGLFHPPFFSEHQITDRSVALIDYILFPWLGMKHTAVSSHECAEKLWNGCGMNNPRKQVLIFNKLLFYT